ncbi:hypothetical protein, partial [Vibrio salinus]|uniref:hypothetical protein n=1 Tax=Vibrio salinus TaxID=2899784 RepID=UPI001E4F33EF
VSPKINPQKVRGCSLTLTPLFDPNDKPVISVNALFLLASASFFTIKMKYYRFMKKVLAHLH